MWVYTRPVGAPARLAPARCGAGDGGARGSWRVPEAYKRAPGAATTVRVGGVVKAPFSGLDTRTAQIRGGPGMKWYVEWLKVV